MLKNNGRAALKILRDHFVGSTKPRLISLYCELTTLKLSLNENVTEYLVRAETCVARLKGAGATVDDSLLIAMVVKGLPDDYKSFTTYMMQQDIDQIGFSKFKAALKNFEENEKARTDYHSDRDQVMKINNTKGNNLQNLKDKTESRNDGNFTCYICSKSGHKSFQCPNRSKKWCNYCKSNTHHTNQCRRKSKNTAKAVQDEEKSDPNSIIFNISEPEDQVSGVINSKYLVDCGATSHILNDKSKFTKFDDNFDAMSHTIK